MEAGPVSGDDVIVKLGQDGRLDSAVLACADIDLYSRHLRPPRLRSALGTSSSLQAIPEKSIAEEGLPQNEASPGSTAPAAVEGNAEEQQVELLCGSLPATEPEAPDQVGAFSRSYTEAMPTIDGRGELVPGRSMKRSHSDPCSSDAAHSSKPKRHSRCLTETAVARKPGKLPESRLKLMVQAARPPLRDKRRHKRVQSMDVTNDPTSCNLVATL